MKVSFDKSSDAAYIKFEPAEGTSFDFERTVGEWPVNVDISRDGQVIGIEFMNASEMLNIKYLEEHSGPPKTEVQQYLAKKKNNKNSD